MNTNSAIRLLILLFLFANILCFTFMQLTEVSSAQTGCPTGSWLNTDPTKLHYSWEKSFSNNVIVKKYYIDDDFVNNHSALVPQIVAGFSQWDTVARASCMKIGFERTLDSEESDIQVLSQSTTNQTDVGLSIATGGIVIGAEIVLDLDNFDPAFDPDNTNPYSTVFLKGTLHEVGHTMGLDDVSVNFSGTSVMIQTNPSSNKNDYKEKNPTVIQQCDKDTVNSNPQCATPTPTVEPTVYPTFPPEGPNCDTSNIGEFCQYSYSNQIDYCDCQQFAGVWDSNFCHCYFYSPIIIDINGDGFNLTSADDGVRFDIDNNGRRQKLGWTAPNSDDAWLVLDRNGNGQIDNGTEMFGNLTPQPDPPAGQQKNGFLALAEFDKPDFGGSSDGRINQQDRVFQDLRLWQDTDHNGRSQPNELSRLPQLDVRAIFLDYQDSKRTDQHGNRFMFRSRVRDRRDADVGKFAFDVFLVSKKVPSQ